LASENVLEQTRLTVLTVFASIEATVPVSLPLPITPDNTPTFIDFYGLLQS